MKPKNKPDIHFKLSLLVFITIIMGCTEDFGGQTKYQSPAWLEGKLYTQILGQDDLKTFARCLRVTGYDSILNTSGSYTVFAPTDEAFELFFQNNPGYRLKLEKDEPDEELMKLVEFQIIYNAWSLRQFQSISINGWVDPNNKLSSPTAYKRQTLLRGENKLYPVKRVGNNFKIVDPAESSEQIRAYNPSNKFSPVFFNEWLNIYDLMPSDYEFYFNRDFHPGKVYFAGAELGEDIPAENGFIYKTDRVVTPLLNGEELLEAGHEDFHYNKFLGIIHQFSVFNINQEATNLQPGVKLGLKVETLYDLSYPGIGFNIYNELTGNISNPLVTFQEHHGLMAPTDEAFDRFIDEYLRDWGGISGVPASTRRIIINSHMATNAIYLTDIDNGFINLEGDWVALNKENIIQSTYGSNCSFIGLNDMIVPRAFNSISRPVYLTRDYEIMLYAIEHTKVLSALKRANAKYAFYLPPDQMIGFDGDSSLVMLMENPDLNRYSFETYNRDDNRFIKISTGDLRKKILNQIAESAPDGIANKEFLRNLGGNYIIVDNIKGTVSGTAPSGSGNIELVPEQLYPGETDNGNVYRVNSWFNFSSSGSYGVLMSKYPKFLNLLQKAGLFNPISFSFPFLTDGEFYTIFIPSVQAMDEYGIDSLPVDELREILKYHFVTGELIFTDGKRDEGYYTTARRDKSSTIYITNYSNLHIDPRPNVIRIMDKYGNLYLEVSEEEGKTNKMISYHTNPSSQSTWDYIVTGVVHGIDKVLTTDSLNINY